jgi:hypothetical protein
MGMNIARRIGIGMKINDFVLKKLRAPAKKAARNVIPETPIIG